MTRSFFDDNIDNVLISHSFERLFPLESYAERSFEPLGEIRTSLERRGIFSLSAPGVCGVPDEPRGRMGCYLIGAQVVGIVVLFLTRCSLSSMPWEGLRVSV